MGASKSACTVGNEERMIRTIVQSPSHSMRQHAQILNFSGLSAHRMLHKIKFYPYSFEMIIDI